MIIGSIQLLFHLMGPGLCLALTTRCLRSGMSLWILHLPAPSPITMHYYKVLSYIFCQFLAFDIVLSSTQ
ncbi:hypothetical protein BT96DRAFT_928383 [Gymnopus androsaceus JB14]|uniref:Uncharacterized protein n=1 Tax=Gymnopus androsaceus JB14 TaxID=1447944 RepID=A0A6A4GKQ5_9AGAR|nr:hypothetical protein BT96DRAFT_928383 [Gymnopus androsaceus JB14]